jgi:V8-like Glu-specific endopeptidase
VRAHNVAPSLKSRAPQAVRKTEAEQARLELAILRLIDEAQRITVQPLTKPAFNFSDQVINEKLMGSESHLRSIGWLEKGLRLSSAVCRLTDGHTYGTGFRCSPDSLLTNNHIIPTETAAQEFRAEFLFEDNGDGNLKTPISTTLDAQRHFWTSQELDVTLVGFAEIPPASIASVSVRPNLLVKINEHVSIIQHPEGGPKQIAVTNNRVLNLCEPFVHYFTDTMPGSSGSPVFCDSWDVVAIHRAGGYVRKNNRGDIIFANEGILTTALLKHGSFCAALRDCNGLPATFKC